MGLIIDSTELIRVERDNAVPRLQGLRTFGEGCSIAAIQVTELAVGLFRADSDLRRAEREAFLQTVLSEFTLIPFGEREARETARLQVLLQQSGQPIGDRDLQIAATALVHGHEIVTRNVREFGKIPGIRIIVPS